MKILLFTGAGASVELGIPPMRGMVEEFHLHLSDLRLRMPILEGFQERLKQPEYDMEELIEYVESVERGQEKQRELNLSYDPGLYSASRTMRWEAEWFVQHVCERLRQADAKTLWGPVLRNLGDHDICLGTTNYDRAIETAAVRNDIQYDDGFGDFSDGEVAHWEGIGSTDDARLTLLKLHGSTDWYMGADDSVHKLRHPMPLYGNLRLAFESDVTSTIPTMTSAMILPSREKRATQPPYPDVTTEFRTAARAAEVAIFLGSSLRDQDLLDVCRQCASRIPTFLVTVDVPWPGPTVPDVKLIRESASNFLVSILPTFLRCGDIGYLQDRADRTSVTTDTVSVLSSLSRALEKDAGVDEVCAAIDNLVSCDAILDLADIRSLLAPDRDATIRKYALALVPHSLDFERACELARELSTADTEGSFAEEFLMMETLMRESSA